MPVELNEWLLRSLRISAFTSNPSLERPELDKLFGIEVESLEVRGPLKESNQIGSLGVGKAVIGQALGRVDFVWRTDDEVFASEPQTLGDIEAAIETFFEPVKLWLASTDGVIRVAVGVGVSLPTEDRAGSYGRLNELVPELTVDPEKVGEVVLQLNRWLDVTDVQGAPMRCNRVMQWSAAKQQLNQMVIDQNGVPVPVGNAIERFVVKCDLDFNSSGERRDALPSDEAFRLVDLLTGEALKALRHGH
jgi:hypothetical protein